MIAIQMTLPGLASPRGNAILAGSFELVVLYVRVVPGGGDVIARRRRERPELDAP